MTPPEHRPDLIDGYLKTEPPAVRKTLAQVRSIIRRAAPRAIQKLAWGMPTFYLHGNLVHFAAFKNHWSLFPGSDVIVQLKKDLARYPTSKGTIQFAYDQPVPTSLVTKVVKACVKRNAAAFAKKQKKKKTGKKK